jgi:hypothetical protein
MDSKGVVNSWLRMKEYTFFFDKNEGVHLEDRIFVIVSAYQETNLYAEVLASIELMYSNSRG